MYVHIVLKIFCNIFMQKVLAYRKVAQTGLFSILDHFVQRSQYISIKTPFINSLKVLECATNQDSLLLETLRYLISVKTILIVCRRRIISLKKKMNENYLHNFLYMYTTTTFVIFFTESILHISKNMNLKGSI